MRKSILAAALLATSLVVAGSASAQAQQDERPVGQRILQGVLDSILPPQQQQEAQQPAQGSAMEQVLERFIPRGAVSIIGDGRQWHGGQEQGEDAEQPSSHGFLRVIEQVSRPVKQKFSPTSLSCSACSRMCVSRGTGMN